MTYVERARDFIAKCAEAAGKDDDEAAHSYKDDACEMAMRAALDNEPGWRETMALALGLSDLDFSRWCA